MCFGGSKRFVQLNPYYGSFSTVKDELESSYSTSPNSDFKFKTNGLFGLRAETHISPGFVPYKVLGIGIDYSFTRINTSFSEIVNFQTVKNNLNFDANRILLSANLYTLVTRYRLLGYISLQGGLTQISKRYLGNAVSFKFSDPLENKSFDYRIGYGFQYFLNSNLGLDIEGGYGGGAYLRTGVTIWF